MRLLVLAAVLGLVGCSRFSTRTGDSLPQRQTDSPGSQADAIPNPNCGGGLSRQQRLYLDLVQKMVEQGQHYAAIAHLDQLEKTAEAAPQSRYLRAEALRGAARRDEAEGVYRGLLSGCMVGHGLHGLGLLAAESGRLDQAEDLLRRASRERPVDAGVRNDLGMVLMLQGRRDSAREQFLTAAELDRSNVLPIENLIVLALAGNQDAEARRLAESRGLTAQDLVRLAERARRLKDSAGTAAFPSPSSQE